MIPWNSASLDSFTLPRAESPSTIYSSRRLTSRLRQSTNFWTRFAMSMEPESFFFTLLFVFSADSLARLFTKICSAALSASCLFSMNQTWSCSLKKAVMASCVKRELTDFFVWFSKQPMVEKQLVTSTRLS